MKDQAARNIDTCIISLTLSQVMTEIFENISIFRTLICLEISHEHRSPSFLTLGNSSSAQRWMCHGHRAPPGTTIKSGCVKRFLYLVLYFEFRNQYTFAQLNQRISVVYVKYGVPSYQLLTDTDLTLQTTNKQTDGHSDRDRLTTSNLFNPQND